MAAGLACWFRLLRIFWTWHSMSHCWTYALWRASRLQAGGLVKGLWCHCFNVFMAFRLVALVFIDMRMMTDPDVPGWEKISATRLPAEYLDEPYQELCSLPDAGCVLPHLVSPSSWSSFFFQIHMGGVGTPALCLGSGLLPPFSIGYCKGWKRGCLMLICLQAIRELDLEDAIQHRIKAWRHVTPISFQFAEQFQSLCICSLLLFSDLRRWRSQPFTVVSWPLRMSDQLSLRTEELGCGGIMSLGGGGGFVTVNHPLSCSVCGEINQI